MRVLELNEALGPSVSLLLAQIALDGASAMMPYHRARRITDGVALIEESPANVDVISRLSELRIESSDLQEHVAANRHVASRNVLRADRRA